MSYKLNPFTKNLDYYKAPASVSSSTRIIDTDTAIFSSTDLVLYISSTVDGTVTVTIPSTEIAIIGREFSIIDTGGNAEINNITIITEGSETINGETTAVIDQDHGSITLTSDGSNLFVK